MSSKKSTALVEDRVFTEIELAELQDHKLAIQSLGKQAEGIAESLAYHLWDINRKRLFEAETKADNTHFKGIVDYAEYTFGIAKGTTSDSVNTFERFGNPETKAIASKYAEYRFSNLMALKKLSDAEIEQAGVTPNDGRSTIKDKLKALATEQEHQNALPDLRTRATEQWNNFIAMYTAQYGKPKKELFESSRYGTELLDRFGTIEPVINELSYEETDALLNMVKRWIADGSTVEPNDETKDSSTAEPNESSTVERPKVGTSETCNSVHVPKKLLLKVQRLIEKELSITLTYRDSLYLETDNE